MKISDRDADLFFDLMFPLQFFVNQELRVAPELNTREKYLASSIEERLPVRDALYEHNDLIDAFVQQNPLGFSEDKLALIARWKNFRAGEFFIERLLKRYAVFIDNEDHVYGVLGLHQPFQEMFHPSALPILGRTVLLPFKGKIVYSDWPTPAWCGCAYSP